MSDVRTDRVLRDMRRMIVTNAVQMGISPEVARLIASSVEERLDLLHGGLETKAERNAAIRGEFNGRNHEHVCRRWGISRRTLYRIIGEGRAA